MKKLLLIPFLALTCGVLLSSCSKEKVLEILPGTGTAWYVVERSESGVSQTDLFTDYKFTFKGGDSLVAAVPGELTQFGTWSASTNNNSLSLEIGTNFNLDKITADWAIKSYSATDFELYKADNQDDILLIRKH